LRALSLQSKNVKVSKDNCVYLIIKKIKLGLTD